MNTVQDVIDNVRFISGDNRPPYKYPDDFILELFNQCYKQDASMLKILQKKDTITGDGTGRYSLDANLTYKPVGISRVFVGSTEIPIQRRKDVDVLEGTPASTSYTAERSDIYIWNRVALSDVETEQTLITGSGELTLAKLDSGQGSLPSFSGNINVEIGSGYQERGVYISTIPSISGGSVTFGLTLYKAGYGGTPYFDIKIKQL